MYVYVRRREEDTETTSLTPMQIFAEPLPSAAEWFSDYTARRESHRLSSSPAPKSQEKDKKKFTSRGRRQVPIDDDDDDDRWLKGKKIKLTTGNRISRFDYKDFNIHSFAAESERKREREAERERRVVGTKSLTCELAHSSVKRVL